MSFTLLPFKLYSLTSSPKYRMKNVLLINLKLTNLLKLSNHDLIE